MPDIKDVAGTIVVGVDGSRSARQALQWASRWAVSTGTPITLLAVLGAPPTTDGQNLGETEESDFRSQVKAMVDAEVAQIRDLSPQVQLNYVDVWGDAATVLVEASQYAQVLALGTRGLGGWTGLLLGGVSDKVLSHAKGTVVVVPPHWKPATKGEPVMLGVDDPAMAESAVAFALTAASSLGAALHVIHAWEVQKGWSALAITFGAHHVEASRHAAQQRLDQVLAMLKGRTEGIDVVSRLVEGNPAVVLGEASAGARLMVMGSRGRGGWSGLLLGSRSRELAQSSACPVAIIRN